MRIAIITIYDPLPNYGNKLQNYAVEQVIKHYFTEQVDTLYVEEQMKVEHLKSLFHTLTKCRFARNKDYWIDYFKAQKFNKFNCNYLHGKRLIDSMVSTISTEYDYFVVGSDQVWNPNLYGKIVDLKKQAYLLSFAEPRQKVCFSPSFGVGELPVEWKEWFQQQLALFPRISVREESGADIVRKLIGKEATVLIDPTLMLDASTWRQLSKKNKKIDYNKRYIFTYLLGEKTNRIQEDLGLYSKELNAEVYDIMDYNNTKLYIEDPSNFLYLIDHAQLVVTDSFHACVFAFLFQKPFLVYGREGKNNNMMSRIETLLKTFHLERKYVDSGIPNQLLECDYSIGYKQLELERKKVENYLKECIREGEES